MSSSSIETRINSLMKCLSNTEILRRQNTEYNKEVSVAKLRLTIIFNLLSI